MQRKAVPGTCMHIDKEGGITVNDCEAVARRIEQSADRTYPDTYVFEVSSPGLGRPLKKEKDYVRSLGKELEIRTYRANRCGQKEFYGVLTAYTDDTVTICSRKKMKN